MPKRGRAAAALDAARERTASAYETARTRSRDAAKQVTDQMAVYPVGAVIGGLAVGALIAFLLPRTERETRLLGVDGAQARRARERGRAAGPRRRPRARPGALRRDRRQGRPRGG